MTGRSFIIIFCYIIQITRHTYVVVASGDLLIWLQDNNSRYSWVNWLFSSSRLSNFLQSFIIIKVDTVSVENIKYIFSYFANQINQIVK